MADKFKSLFLQLWTTFNYCSSFNINRLLNEIQYVYSCNHKHRKSFSHPLIRTQSEIRFFQNAIKFKYFIILYYQKYSCTIPFKTEEITDVIHCAFLSFPTSKPIHFNYFLNASNATCTDVERRLTSVSVRRWHVAVVSASLLSHHISCCQILERHTAPLYALSVLK